MSLSGFGPGLVYHRSEISYDHILVLTHLVVLCFCAGIIKCPNQDLDLVWFTTGLR